MKTPRFIARQEIGATSFSDILTGIILFFIIGSEFFINFRIVFRGQAKEKPGTADPNEIQMH